MFDLLGDHGVKFDDAESVVAFIDAIEGLAQFDTSGRISGLIGGMRVLVRMSETVYKGLDITLSPAEQVSIVRFIETVAGAGGDL